MSLYDALKQFRQEDRISFHIPGHKGGKGLNPDWVRDAFSLDVTEFAQTDDLQNPEGILRDALERIARIYGAEASFFLTNGSSSGLEAAMLSVIRPGEKILVDRTCHKAVASGLVLSGGVPIFLEPEFSKELRLYLGISPEKVKKILAEDPEIRGMVLTSPTYYGVCSPVKEIAEILHQAGKFLIVDEAHGAHLTFHPDLPKSALDLGADLVVQSVHKTLPALGQSSLLHLGKGSFVTKEQVASSLRLLMTTSPSYLLMSAMDEAVSMMEKDGQALLEILLREIHALKKAVRDQGILDFADEERLKIPQDKLRLTVDFGRCGISGTDGAELLKKAYGIYPEMADDRYLVLIVTTANTVEELQLLRHALIEIATPGTEEKGIDPIPLPEMAMNPRDAWMSKKESVSFAEAKGRISADTVAVCPPGAAILIPGQYIDDEVLEYLQKADAPETISVVVE